MIRFFLLSIVPVYLGLTSPAGAQAPKKIPRPPGRTVLSDVPWDPKGLQNQKVIYGDDDRLDVFELDAFVETDAMRLSLAKSVCALMSSAQLTDNGNDTTRIQTSFFRINDLLPCAGEPFGNQPTAAFCTGFLVGEDIIVTAGHCYDSSHFSGTRFVFGFVMNDATDAVTVVPDENIYQGVEIISQVFSNSIFLDYSVIRVDRRVTVPGAEPLEIRRTGTIPLGTQVGVMGYPSGLPLKIAFGDATTVQGNTEFDFFTANLDTYGGNSGSPIFNAATGVVEGILVRGEQDFITNGGCFVSNQLSDSIGSGGEESTKTTRFEEFVPLLVSSAGVVEIDSPAYRCEDVLTATVRDSDLVANAVVTVSTSGGDSETLILSPDPFTNGRFIGSVSLSGGSRGIENGILEVAEGETITVRYSDANDGSGESAEVSVTAVVDCTAPQLFAPEVLNVSGAGATVAFTANELVTAIVSAGTNCGVLNFVSSSASLDVEHAVSFSNLAESTAYFFEIAATDSAGNTTVLDNGGNCFAFETTGRRDYFTEILGYEYDAVDLENTTFRFTPDGSPDFYSLCAEPASAFEIDPLNGSELFTDVDDYGDDVFGDDDSFRILLTGDEQVSLYGTSYGSFFINGNGNISFGEADITYFESFDAHFSQPRISPFFHDLNPAVDGSVRFQQMGDRAVVTYLNIPTYGESDSNNFQIQIFFNGDIVITYLRLGTLGAVVGLSEGLGVPADFIPTDLSASETCLAIGEGEGEVQTGPVIGVSPGSIEFEIVPLGLSVDRLVSVSNTGGETLAGTASASEPFQIVLDPEYTVPPGESRPITVRFTPSSSGFVSGSAAFTGGGGASVGLSGTGFGDGPEGEGEGSAEGIGEGEGAGEPEGEGEGEDVGPPEIGVSPQEIEFGRIPVFGVVEREITVSNTGAGILSGSVSVDEPFQIVFGSPYEVSAGESTTVDIRFAPTVVGDFSEAVAFTGGGNAFMAVFGSSTVFGGGGEGEGEAIDQSEIGVAPAEIEFGTISVASFVDRTVTVINTGLRTLEGSVTVTAPFEVVLGSPYEIEAGGSATVVLRFVPVIPGDFSAAAAFGGGGGQFVALFGKAIAAGNEGEGGGEGDPSGTFECGGGSAGASIGTSGVSGVLGDLLLLCGAICLLGRARRGPSMSSFLD